MSISWVSRWNYQMASKPSAPGVYRLKTGGYYVRSQFGNRALPGATLPEAVAARLELTKPRDVLETRPLCSTFASQLLDEKLAMGKIESLATEELWKGVLTNYLIPHLFSGKRVDELTKQHIIDFKKICADWIKNGKPSLKDSAKNVKLSGTTVNGWLRILRVICNEMVDRFDLPRNPYRKIELFLEKNPHTRENPNTLTVVQLRRWLVLARVHYPQHYAIMHLGFCTGRRPSELRALRRNIDVNWKLGQVTIRRSHSRKQAIMEHTKTKKDPLVINLPESLMKILREHVKTLPKDCELLFPSRKGTIRARTGLKKPFDAIALKMKLNFRLTPKAMRRAYQDLARTAGTVGLVQRSISGHETEEMKDHYSTVSDTEQRKALDKMMRLLN